MLHMNAVLMTEHYKFLIPGSMSHAVKRNEHDGNNFHFK